MRLIGSNRSTWSSNYAAGLILFTVENICFHCFVHETGSIPLPAGGLVHVNLQVRFLSLSCPPPPPHPPRHHTIAYMSMVTSRGGWTIRGNVWNVWTQLVKASFAQEKPANERISSVVPIKRTGVINCPLKRSTENYARRVHVQYTLAMTSLLITREKIIIFGCASSNMRRVGRFVESPKGPRVIFYSLRNERTTLPSMVGVAAGICPGNHCFGDRSHLYFTVKYCSKS